MNGNTKNLGKRFGKLVVIDIPGRKYTGVGEKGYLIYTFKCDCGNVFDSGFKYKYQLACKECRKLGRHKSPQSLNSRYKQYKHSAAQRNYEFEINIYDFDRLTSQPCYYCNSFELYNGLDRVDNKNGYLIDNVVPCCSVCNKSKNTLNREEFLNHIKRIYTQHF